MSSTPPSLITIIGCGYVGSRAAECFLEEGRAVTAIRRNPPSSITTPQTPHPSPCWVQADVCSEDWYSKLWASPCTPQPETLSSHTIIYSVAADNGSPEAYKRAYFDGLASVLGALKGPGARGPAPRVIFVSSTGVLAEDNGELVTEETTPRPARPGLEWLIRGEQLLLEEWADSVILRLSGIYGPGRMHILKRIQSGNTYPPAELMQWTNRIHRDDAAGIIRYLTTLPDPEKLYHGTDSQPALRKEIVEYLVSGNLDPAHPPSAHPTTGTPASGKRLSNERILNSGYRFLFPSFKEGFEGAL